MCINLRIPRGKYHGVLPQPCRDPPLLGSALLTRDRSSTAKRRDAPPRLKAAQAAALRQWAGVRRVFDPLNTLIHQPLP
jgi:hypothetical protein